MSNTNRFAVKRALPSSNIDGWFVGSGFFAFALERFVEPRLQEFQMRIDRRLIGRRHAGRNRQRNGKTNKDVDRKWLFHSAHSECCERIRIGKILPFQETVEILE